MKNMFAAEYLCYKWKTKFETFWCCLWLPMYTRFKLGIFLGGELWIFSLLSQVWWVWLALLSAWIFITSPRRQSPKPSASSLQCRSAIPRHTPGQQNNVVTGNYLNIGERAEDNWENYLTSLVGEERILQTTPPEPPDSRATKSRMKSPAHKLVKEPLKSILNIAIKSWICNICLTSRSCHLSWRPRASRCHHRYLWRRTWSWTEGKSQPTDVC